MFDRTAYNAPMTLEDSGAGSVLRARVGPPTPAASTKSPSTIDPSFFTLNITFDIAMKIPPGVQQLAMLGLSAAGVGTFDYHQQRDERLLPGRHDELLEKGTHFTCLLQYAQYDVSQQTITSDTSRSKRPRDLGEPKTQAQQSDLQHKYFFVKSANLHRTWTDKSHRCSPFHHSIASLDSSLYINLPPTIYAPTACRLLTVSVILFSKLVHCGFSISLTREVSTS